MCNLRKTRIILKLKNCFKIAIELLINNVNKFFDQVFLHPSFTSLFPFNK